MKKIIYFNQRWTSGGIEKIICQIIKKIDENNIILTIQKESNIYDDVIKKYKTEFVTLNQKKYRNPIIRNISSLNSYKIFIKENNPDIIHINIYNAISNIYVYIAKKLNIKKIIVHAHNNGFDNDKFHLKELLNNISKKIFYIKQAEYIACSMEAAEFCFNKEIIQRKKVKIITNPIETEKFKFNENTREKYRKKFKYSPTDIIFGNIGRITEQKNQMKLLEIFNEIKKINNNSKLLIVGDGELKEKIIKKAKKMKLGDSFRIISARNDINGIMDMMDIFVFPSKYEGLGIVALEAQTNGLPTFISNNLPKNLNASSLAYRFSILDDNKKIAEFILKNSHNYEKRMSPDMKNYDEETFIKKIKNIYGIKE